MRVVVATACSIVAIVAIALPWLLRPAGPRSPTIEDLAAQPREVDVTAPDSPVEPAAEARTDEPATRRESVAEPSDEDNVLLDIPPGRVAGRVTDERRNAIANARVRIECSGFDRVELLTTSADGRFVSAELPPDWIEIAAEHDAYAATAHARRRMRAIS
ncbi:MAG: carboxypeptidase regulatory-like domain-containing protein, partial [Planctomycetes bacterium]|nr:carboxypeptidase regulatory-like domain-containing protein [Planctomycetota bacterium]